MDNLDIPVLFRNLMFCLFILFFLGVTVPLQGSEIRSPETRKLINGFQEPKPEVATIYNASMRPM